MKLDYQAALDYILGFTDYEKIPGILYTSSNYDLRRMEEILRWLGDPHLAAKSVHIAGTKGKGSTAAMIASALTASGYRVGLFTSPHLHSLRERIQINGELISEEEFAALVDKLRPKVDMMNAEAAYGQLTTFEILAALAFAYFAQKGVDFQIAEVGLGGRLDATNVVKPEVCIITSISLDHTEVLGTTLTEIAAEKAGIIKPGCVVVSAPQPLEAAKVIGEACLRQGARLIKVGSDFKWWKTKADIQQQSFEVMSKTESYHLTIPLLGEHQLENAATTIAALEVLAARGTRLKKENIARGLAQVNWKGRFQILQHQPLIVVDGAHNADSASKLIRAIGQHLAFDRSILVMGTSVDKDIPGMVKELAPFFSRVIVTHSQHPRAAKTSVLVAEFAKQGVEAEGKESVSSALAHALSIAGEKDLVCVTGSLFVVAEAIEYIESQNAL